MDIEKLKQKILDLAIRGKLVLQDPNDEPASVLIEKIRAEKESLIKQGKIKRDKNESYIFKGDDNSYYENVGGKTVCINDEIPFDIPENWMWARLGNIGKWAAGATPLRSNLSYYKHGTIPWLKTGELNDGIITTTEEYITELALTECSLHINPIGSILIAMYGATIGKLAITGIELTTNQACCACQVSNNIEKQYLFFFLQAIKKLLIKKGAGGAQPNISREIIVGTLIAIPPKQEQERISKKLSILLKITSQLTKFENDITKLSELLKYKILDSFFGENSRYKSYYSFNEKKLSEIASLITKGSTPTTYGFEYLSKGINFIKVENVKDYCVQHDTIKQFISEKAHEFQKRSQLKKDDLLISIAGTLGRICLIKDEDLPANTNQAFAIVRGFTQTLLPDYLKWFITWYVLTKSQQLGHGGGMDNLTLGEIKALRINYPISKDEQYQIVDKINDCLVIISLIQGL